LPVSDDPNYCPPSYGEFIKNWTDFLAETAVLNASNNY
jgi:hypothetical protein